MTNELAERRKIIEQRIPDSGMRDLIFDFAGASSDFLSNRRKYIDYVRTTLYLVTLIAYRKFVLYKTGLERAPAEKKAREVSEFSNAMVRLYNMFDGCYSSGRLDFGLVENVILNLQVDAAMNRSRGFLESVGMQYYFNFSFLGNDLSKFIFSLKKSMLSSRDPIQFDFDDLVRFFTAFPFLLNAKLRYVDFGHSDFPLRRIVLEINGETLDMGNLVVELNEQVNYLYGVTMTDPRKLTKSDPAKEQRVTAEYVAFCGAGDFEIVFSDTPFKVQPPRSVCVVYDTAVEDFLLGLRLFNVQSGKDSYFFRDFFFVDNKYIKYLALTISDLINAESKRKLFEHFGTKYGSVFKKLSGAHIIRWDEIFVFLLLEVGIYNLLTYLFKETNLSYEEVKEAFRLRFGKNVSKLEEEYDIIRDPSSSLLLRNTNNIIHCRVQALILLATRLLTANEVKVSVSDSLASIAEILDELRAVEANAQMRESEKILYYVNKLINFNSFIVIFYQGLLNCYDQLKARDLEESARLLFFAHEDMSASVDRFAFFRQATLQVRRRMYDRCNRMLRIKTLDAETFGTLKELVGESFAWLTELNGSLNIRNTSMNEQFYDITGRRRLLDEEVFRHVSSDVMAKFTALSERKGAANGLCDAIIQYLEYMRDGSTEQHAPIEGAVYPVIGTCSQTVMSQDGYRYSYLSVNTGRGENRIDIKIISNENMNIGDVYYCVPNIKRCLRVPSEHDKEKYIWINPQIIPYESYQSNADAAFEQLNNREDYEKAAALIYSSDTRLYGKMFGSLENAKKVLCVLFDKRRSVYSKNYVRLLRVSHVSENVENEIIAVATLYPELPDWDESVFENAFRTAGVPMTDDTRYALESVRDTFDDTIGNNYYVCDLCVEEKYRGKGYAKYMLNCLIRVAEKDIHGKNVVLSVYEDNAIALNLYNLMGFIPYVSGYDNRGEGRNYTEKYFKMIKYT